MTVRFGPARRWLLWLLLAAGSHVLALWILPHAVMRMAMSRLVAAAPPAFPEAALGEPSGAASVAAPEEAAGAAAAASAARGGALYPPLSTAASRLIVLPSPDLAYALCLYDLRDGPVDIDAQPDWPAYWSVALYADNTDNYLVRNDRIAASRPVHWRLALTKGTPAAGRELVLAPSARGLVLMRVLVTDRASQAATVAQAQRALQCVPAKAN
jgi:uncharacterized membrane protein